MNLKIINIKYSNLNLKKINLPDKASLKENKNQKLSISYDRNEIKTDQLLDCLRSQGLEILDLSTEEADLADVFKLLTKSNGKRTPPKKDGISVNSRKTPINTVSNFNK